MRKEDVIIAIKDGMLYEVHSNANIDVVVYDLDTSEDARDYEDGVKGFKQIY